MQKTLFTVILTLLYSIQVGAQSLRECIELALQNSFELQIHRNDEEIAGNKVSWSNAGALPTIETTAAYRPTWRTMERSVSRATGQATTQNNAIDNALSAGVSLDWTLFDGYSIQTTYKQYQLLQQQGELNTRIAIEDLIADIASEYYYYLQQVIRKKNLMYSMSLSRERLRIADLNYETGRLSGLDRKLALADFHADSIAYIAQDEALTSSRIRLNSLMTNSRLDAPITLIDTTISLRQDLSIDDLWEKTLAANSTILKAAQNTRLAELDLKKVLSRNYPYLRLNAQYGYNHTFYDRAANSQTSNLTLNGGLTLGFNIFDGRRRRERRNAELSIQNSKLQSQQIELNLHSRLITFWEAYCNDLKLIDLQNENLTIARSNYEAAMERYKLGDLSGFDLRQVQDKLLDAEQRVLNVLYDAKISEISLLQISGHLTDYLKP